MPSKFTTGFNVRVTKDGYVPATKMVAAAHPDVSLSVTLQSLAAPADMTGNYTLTLAADTACASQLPEGLRTRTYAATISPGSFWGSLPGMFSGTVSGGSFLPDHNAFVTGVAGDDVGFSIVDDDNADGVVERVDPSSYLNLVGSAHATIGPTGVATISALFDGRFEYCVGSGSPTGDTSFYTCSTSHPVARCSSKNHHLILTRR
jgi:hypothetical protein